MTDKPDIKKPDIDQSEMSKVITDEPGEKVSSLVDGELEDAFENDSCIDHLVKNKEAGQCWESYHLISDTLKRNLPRFIDNKLASRVMAELKNEPTILAPSRVSFNVGKQVAGLAIAASVATVAVLGVQFMYKEDGMAPSSQIAQTQGVQSQPQHTQASTLQASKTPIRQEFIHRDVQTVTQALEPASPHPQRFSQQFADQHKSQIFNQHDPDLNKYLLNHNQHAARGMVQGVMPYARIITSPDMGFVASKKILQNQNQNQTQR